MQRPRVEMQFHRADPTCEEHKRDMRAEAFGAQDLERAASDFQPRSRISTLASFSVVSPVGVSANPSITRSGQSTTSDDRRSTPETTQQSARQPSVEQCSA